MWLDTLSDDHEIGRALSYQEAVTRWIPIRRDSPWQPRVVWAIACAAILGITFLVVMPFSSEVPTKARQLTIALLISYVATVFEILGIIWGCAESEKLAARLPEIVQFTPDQAESWRDKYLRTAWRCPGVLISGLVLASVAALIPFAFEELLPLRSRVATIAIATWFSFGAFWCGAAMFHIGAVSFAIYRLSKEQLRTAFPHPDGLGISEVGRLALTYFFVYAFAAMLWMFVSLFVLPAATGGYSGFWRVGLGATSVGICLFAVPQLSIHAAMLQNHRQQLTALLQVLEGEYRSAIHDTVRHAANQARVKELLELYGFIAKFPTWAFDITVVSKVIPASVLPLLPPLLNYFYPGRLQ